MIVLFTICFQRTKIIVKRLASSCQNLPEDLPCARKPSGLWNYGAEGHRLYGNRKVQQDGKFSLE